MPLESYQLPAKSPETSLYGLVSHSRSQLPLTLIKETVRNLSRGIQAGGGNTALLDDEPTMDHRCKRDDDDEYADHSLLN